MTRITTARHRAGAGDTGGSRGVTHCRMLPVDPRHGRRRFDHLVTELSVAVGQKIPRYALWLRLHEYGWNPDELSRDEAISFCGTPLSSFLATQGLRLRASRQRRLQREMARYDPALPTPYERMARF